MGLLGLAALTLLSLGYAGESQEDEPPVPKTTEELNQAIATPAGRDLAASCLSIAFGVDRRANSPSQHPGPSARRGLLGPQPSDRNHYR